MTKDFVFLVLLGQKKIYLITRYKKVHDYAHNFSVSFFSALGYTSPNVLRDARERVEVLLLLRLVEPFVFYNHHTP